MKVKTRESKGITLIALVITIIVLLILAGVSIAMLSGENGILSQANKAKVEQSHATVKEGMILAYNDWKIKTIRGETTKLASTETVMIQGEEERTKANTTLTFLDFLNDKKYIKENTENVIDVEKLTGSKQALGNGTTTDIYTITEESGVYILNYINEETTPLEIWSTENENAKPALGKLADVVKVGDYVNYAPSYENVSPLKDGLGNGWRVAYVEDGAVTLISEGVPLVVDAEDINEEQKKINVNSEDVNNLFDDSVANNIDIPTINDFLKIGEQAGITLTYNDSNYWEHPWESPYMSEGYKLEGDNINIIDIDLVYLINDMATDAYGEEHYYLVGISSYGKFGIFANNKGNYSSEESIRLVVSLKNALDYFGGTGSQSDPYQIY